jgi:hypothetical protein
MTSDSSSNAATVAISAAAGLTAASIAPILTQWVQLGTAVLGFLCMAYGTYKLFFGK